MLQHYASLLDIYDMMPAFHSPKSSLMANAIGLPWRHMRLTGESSSIAIRSLRDGGLMVECRKQGVQLP